MITGLLVEEMVGWPPVVSLPRLPYRPSAIKAIKYRARQKQEGMEMMTPAHYPLLV